MLAKTLGLLTHTVKRLCTNAERLSFSVFVFPCRRGLVAFAALLSLCSVASAQNTTRLVAVPYIERLPSWLVLWNNSTGPDGTPTDETWTIAINDRIVSRRQAELFEVVSNEGYVGGFPATGPLVLHRQAAVDSEPALAVRIYWPDNLPESITFQITLKVQDGNLESTSKSHNAKLWKAIRSASPVLPSVTPDPLNHDSLHYNASWVGGPGPIQTTWRTDEGLEMLIPTNPESRFFDVLHYPSVHAEYPWLDAYDNLPWFSTLTDDNFGLYISNGEDHRLHLVGSAMFEGSAGTSEVPVSVELLSPLNTLLSTIFGIADSSATKLAWFADARGTIDGSTDDSVSDYQGGLEIIPFKDPAQGGYKAIVINI